MTRWPKIVAVLAALALLLGLALPAGAATQTGSGVWGAGIDQHAATRVSGKIHVPAVASTCGSSSMVAAWVGIGGWDSEKLAQLGVTLYPNGGIGAWYEADVSGTDYVEATEPMTINPGDYLQLSMAFLNDETEIEFKWWDTTNGALHYVTLSNAYQYWSDTSAEWVVERVEGHPVADFGTLHWYAAWYGTPSTATDAAPLTDESMLVDSYDYDLASISTVAGYPQDLDMSWHRCT